MAVVDVDYHHGNGTQDIFWARGDVLVTNLHGDPRQEYPFFTGYADERGEGAGVDANRNYPLPHGHAGPGLVRRPGRCPRPRAGLRP